MTIARVPRDAIERAKAAMQEAPRKSLTDTKKIEAVRLMTADIRRMRAKGYSFAEIAEIVRGAGVDVSADGIKTMLRRNKRKAEMEPETKGRKRKDPSTPRARSAVFTPRPDTEL